MKHPFKLIALIMLLPFGPFYWVAFDAYLKGKGLWNGLAALLIFGAMVFIPAFLYGLGDSLEKTTGDEDGSE